ncbi:universal stress protein [Salinarchaeum sp. IM2453]|uniref:universal stress protein n=1 Tax=Salinarchaeum sp. IM2453 TaxID=2862870 RepID=UPI001C82AA03|nr:universal stress protein [Salinarchaeum sp. IM2453]QZA88065.1 universal stress protein [Salinarchaeum sp. IM2453]
MSADDAHALIAVDDSDPCQAAVRFALDNFWGSKITLLHVVAPGIPVTQTRVYQEAAEQEEIEDHLAEFKQQFNDAGFDAKYEFAEGTPHNTIVEFAMDNDIDHIFIGSHGRKGIDRVLLGSVAEKVIRRSAVPVTVIR